MKSIKALSLMLVVLFTTSCSNVVEPQKLVFAGAPLQSSSIAAEDSFKLMFDLIENEMGVNIEFLEVSDRATIVEGLAAGNIDFASMDPFGYVLASAIDDEVRPLASYIRDPKIAPGFTSIAVARKDNKKVTDLKNLDGLKVCFSDPASTAGYLYPASEIESLGTKIDLTSGSGIEYLFTGIVPSQPAVNVYDGACDIGFIPDSQWLGVLPTLENFNRDDLKIIWESEHIPGLLLAAGSTISDETFAKLQEIITTKANKTYFVEQGQCESETDCLFLSPANWGYLKIDAQDYEVVREKCVTLGLTQCKK